MDNNLKIIQQFNLATELQLRPARFPCGSLIINHERDHHNRLIGPLVDETDNDLYFYLNVTSTRQDTRTEDVSLTVQLLIQDRDDNAFLNSIATEVYNRLANRIIHLT